MFFGPVWIFFFFLGEIPALWQQAINLCYHSTRTDAYTEIKSNTEHRRNTQVEINSIFSLAYKTQIGFQRITKTQEKKNQVKVIHVEKGCWTETENKRDQQRDTRQT